MEEGRAERRVDEGMETGLDAGGWRAGWMERRGEVGWMGGVEGHALTPNRTESPIAVPSNTLSTYSC